MGLSFLDGIHLVSAYVQHIGSPRAVFVDRSHASDVEVSNLLEQSDDAFLLPDSLFAKLSSVATPTGIVALVETPRPHVPADPGACILLEDLQDPGNVGSILRSAAAADVQEVYLSQECVDAWSPRVLRAGMGAHFALRVFERVDLAAFAHAYAGRLVATAGDAARSIYETDLTGTVALAFGNEGGGLSAALRGAAHASVAVPVSEKVESLNVAAAAAVCLFERVRQLSKSAG